MATFDTNQSSPRNVVLLDVTSGCTLRSPTFLSQPNHLAVIRTCYGTTRTPGTSQVLVFNVFTGKPVAIVASALPGTTFIRACQSIRPANMFCSESSRTFRPVPTISSSKGGTLWQSVEMRPPAPSGKRFRALSSW